MRLTNSLTGPLTGSLTPTAADGWNHRPMATRTQQRDARRWVLPFLAALVAALAAILVGNLSPASAAAAAETRVRASSVASDVLVGPPEHIAAGQRLGEAADRVVLTVATGVVAKTVPGRVARVMDTDVADVATRLGAPGAPDVFVTPAGELDRLTSHQIAERLTLLNEDGSLRTGPFSVFEFDTPEGIASPINRGNPGFVPGGATGGGAPEYVVPNLRFDELQNLTRRDAP